MVKLGKVNCFHCSKEFERRQVEIDRSIRLNKRQFCCAKCVTEASKTTKTHNCTECGIEFSRKAKESKKSKNLFCSRSCSGTYYAKNPTKWIKTKQKKPQGECKVCKIPIRRSRKYCDKCKLTLDDKITLKDLKYSKGLACNAYGCVRSRARTVAKNLGWNCCVKCGYNKHIEIAHVKQIPSFPDDTLISVINHPSNLLPLCPNCHWEFDHPK